MERGSDEIVGVIVQHAEVLRINIYHTRLHCLRYTLVKTQCEKMTFYARCELSHKISSINVN
jgi:hypothetical protein